MSAPSASDILDDDAPLWLINEQIKGLLEGVGADEDHRDVLNFLRHATGLPEGTIRRIHSAIVHGDTKVLPEQIGTPGAIAITKERRRQIEAEGWTPEHDDANPAGVMSVAAGCYALSAGYALALAGGDTSTCPAPEAFPWDDAWWKPTTSRRDLVKAAALILAEIERLDRMAERQEGANG